MRRALALLLLACVAVGQENGEKRDPIAQATERNEELKKRAQEAAATLESVEKERATSKERLDSSAERLTQLQTAYERDETRPDRFTVQQEMERFRREADSSEQRLELLRELRNEALSDQERLLTSTANWEEDWAELVGASKDASLGVLENERRATIAEWRKSVSNRVLRAREALTDENTVRERYIRMVSIHERENLLLREGNTITWESIRQATLDLAHIPDWLGSNTAAVRDYLAAPRTHAAAVRWLVIAAVSFVLLFALGRILRRFANAVVAQADGGPDPRRTYRVLARLLRRILLFTWLFTLFASAAWVLPDLPDETRTLLLKLGRFFASAYFIWALYRELLRPDQPERALVEVDDQARRRISRAVTVVLLIAVVLRPLQLALEAFGYGNLGAVDMIEALMFLAFSYLLTGVIFRKKVFAQLLPQGDARWAKLVRALGGILRPFLMLLMPLLLVLHLARFELLADAVSRYSLALLGSLIASSLLYQLGKTIALQWMHRAYGDDVEKKGTPGFATTNALLFTLRAVFFLVGVWLLARLSGTDLDGLRFALEASLPFTGGENAPTWWSLFAALALFVFFFFGAPHIKQLLRYQVLDRTRMEESTRYTITTLVGYVFLAAGAVIAVRQIFDLSVLGTIVAALSVGIGFGLQEIVSNFISGIILLFERPIRVGDLIEVGPNIGKVDQINIRATTVKTADNIFLLVPNRDLMSNSVVNYGYADPKVRLKIPVGVSYDTDPEQVREILLGIAKENDLALSNPPPAVWFKAMADSSLNFELLIWLRRADQRMQALSDFNFAIFKALGDAGIEIPFPQSDLHIRSGLEPRHASEPTKSLPAESDPPPIEGDED
ncbi:MAG: mechanosensitive ion channel domain-containing protein [Planctomycetota bacterium]